MHENLSRLHPVASSSNRSFGWVFVGAFLIIALWPLMTSSTPRPWALVVSGVLVVVTALAPSLLTVPNRLWMRLGKLLHHVTSPVLLAVMFYAVVTPMGWLMRIFRKDALQLHFDPSADSYWIKRDPPGPAPDSMSNQF